MENSVRVVRRVLDVLRQLFGTSHHSAVSRKKLLVELGRTASQEGPFTTETFRVQFESTTERRENPPRPGGKDILPTPEETESGEEEQGPTGHDEWSVGPPG